MGNDKVRITADLADMLKSIALPPAAQRLFLALVYMQDQTGHCWTRQTWHERSEAQFFCALNNLRVLGCAPKAGNARFFRTAVAALGQRADLFARIELCTSSSRLVWSFSAEVWQAMSQMEPYGLLEIGDIAHLAGRRDLSLLTQIVVQRGKRYPEFVLSGADLGVRDAGATVATFDLRQMRRMLEPALARWASYLGSPIVVGYEQRAHAPGYIQARLRFQGPKSAWTARSIQRFRLNTKIVSV
ncbi:MAG: hypothetical protein ACU0A8_07545 [Limimaricola soesokkakensis]|uniref:hypothetical protein n=1 Tax=Limimaricola soesokkakensis TaxID=1343159 RepID=UPI0040590F8E